MANEEDNRPIPGTYRLVCPTPPGTELATKWIAKEPVIGERLVWTEKFDEGFVFHEYEKAKTTATTINDSDSLDKVVVQGKGAPLVDQPPA